MYKSFKKFDKAYGFTAKCGFELKDLQVKDAEEFVQWRASLNTYEVGSGKTVLSTVVALMRDADFVIVTAPPILIPGWVKWLKQVSDNVLMYRGTPKERAAMPLHAARWVVVSHAIFRTDYDRLMEELLKRERPEIIVDEAHNLKNVSSILYKKVKQALPHVHLQMLTGTPLSNPLDAYSYIALKEPGAYRSYEQFRRLHVESEDFFGKPTRFRNLDILKRELSVRTISRTKKEIHGYDLTPIFPDTTYELSDKHYALYRRLVEEQLLTFEDGSKIDATSAAALRHALQQVVVNFDHFSNDPKNRSAAYDIIDQTLEETGCSNVANSKLIIWTKYKMTSAKVTDYCNRLKIKTVAAYSGADSSASAEAFMSDPSVRILVANPQSAGAGLNPQFVCSEALFLEMDTVPIYNRQSIGRLDRAGQTTTPRMRIAVAENTVQVGLYRDMLAKDDTVQKIEPTKDSLRQMLLGRS